MKLQYLIFLNSGLEKKQIHAYIPGGGNASIPSIVPYGISSLSSCCFAISAISSAEYAGKFERNASISFGWKAFAYLIKKSFSSFK